MFEQSFPEGLAIRLALLDFAVQIPDGNDGKGHRQALACHLIKHVRDELFHKSAAVPAFQAGSFAGGIALGILHGAWHPAHPGTEGLLSGCISLGLGVRGRSLEVATSLPVVLGPAFGSEAGSFGDGKFLALLDGEVDLFLRHLEEAQIDR